MSEPLRGPGDLARAVDTGRDVNADLERPVGPGDTATRAAAAVSMKIAGASYSDIARTLGYSSAFHARSAVERVLAESADDEDDKARMKVLISRRLDRLLKSVMPRAVDPKDPEHLAYNARALAIVDRQARLHGADAPATAVVVTPDAQRVEQYVATVLALARAGDAAQEQDIIEAELDEE